MEENIDVQNTEQQGNPAEPLVQQTEDQAPAADPLAVAQEENRILRDQLMRAAADFDNYRRRMMTERAELIANANEKLLRELLPLVDDFRRSIQTDDAGGADPSAFGQGVRMILAKAEKLLESQGVRPIQAVGQHFDVDLHEALLRQPSEAPEDTVIGEVEPGYMYNDRVLRFAKVIVSAGNA